MSLKDTIVSALKADSGVAALVGTRIYKDKAYEKAAHPFIVVYRISGDRHAHMKGSSGLLGTRTQVDCVARNDSDMDAVANAVVQGMYGKTQESIGTSPNNQSIQFIDVDGDNDDIAVPTQSDRRGGAKPLYTRKLDLVIWHTETVPS